MTTTRAEVIVTGGGTAGHVLPAIALARALVAAGHVPSTIHFVGTRRGMEGRLVPDAGFSLTLLPGRGVVRRPSLRNVTALAGIGVAFVLSLATLARRRPRVVVAVGGFGAVACSLAAAVLRIPVVVVNVDSVPGAANRMIGRFARACAVAFPATELPRAVVTGAPVRPEVLAVDRSREGRARARRALSVAGDGTLVGVVGGSLGARRLNDAALDLAQRLPAHEGFVVYHVCGTRALEEVTTVAGAAGLFGPRRARLPGRRLRGPPGGTSRRGRRGGVPRRRLDRGRALRDRHAEHPRPASRCTGGPPATERGMVARRRRGGAPRRRRGDRGAALPEVLALLGDPGRLEAMGAAARSAGRPDAAAAVAALVDEVAAWRWAGARRAGRRDPSRTTGRPMSGPDLGRRRGVHIVGIGGAGMSAIATVLVAMGHEVSGSDLKDGVALERLRALGVKVAIGHDAANLGAAEFLAISSAVPTGNVEVVEARRRGIAVHRRAEVLGAISSLRRTIAVSGTHGKTTTSSMLALILVEAGLSPSFIIGGEINEIGSGAVWDAGEWLVVEADESDGTFLELQSEIAVVTSVEPDHLDHYGSFEGLVAAFRRFLAGASSVAIVCGDYPTAAAVAPRDVTTYGFAADSTWRITEFAGGRSEVSFVLRVGSDSATALALPVPGRHNALNAAGAAAAAVAVGADLEAVRRALARFGGVTRRFEFRGEANGATLVDDYAHLPGEVAAALATARRGGWRRVVCVFQPHRYSRIAVLGADFADAFVDADELIVTDIYGAGEAPRPGVSGRLVVDAVRVAHPEADVTYLPRRTEIVDHLRRTLRAGDCCLTLGAGDLTSLADDLLAGGED